MRPILAVVEYQATGYRNVWRGSVFSSFAMPLLFFVGIGVTIGSVVDTNGTLGVPYAVFVGSGLIVFIGVQVGLLESGIPVFASLHWSPVIKGMRHTPLRALDIVLGQMSFIALRVLAATSAFILVMLAFGAVTSPWAAGMPFVAALAAVAVAAPNYALTCRAESAFKVESVTKTLTVILLLFSGVFFPVSVVPEWAQPVAWVSPLWHAVELSRDANAVGEAAVAVHLAYLTAWTVVGVYAATRQLSKTLRD